MYFQNVVEKRKKCDVYFASFSLKKKATEQEQMTPVGLDPETLWCEAPLNYHDTWNVYTLKHIYTYNRYYATRLILAFKGAATLGVF